MKRKLFARLAVPLAFVAAFIFAGCSDPNSSSASTSDVPKGSVIEAIYSGGGTRVVFKADSTVEFLDNGNVSARAVAGSNGKVCARGTYVVTADNIAQITITEVLCDWGEISKTEFDIYKNKDVAIKVAFNGNELHITIDEKPLSFSTDEKVVSKPSGGKPPVQSGPAFSNGLIDATYVQRQTLILKKDGTFSSTSNIAFEYDTEDSFEGTYAQSGNNITLELASSTVWGSEIEKATATISGDTLTLTIVFIEESEEGKYTYAEKIVFKKRLDSDTEWEHSEKVVLSSNGDIKYYENDALCWNGKYTIIDAETASVKVNTVYIAGSFGTDSGNLYIEDASQESLDLDLIDSGGIAMCFARER